MVFIAGSNFVLQTNAFLSSVASAQQSGGSLEAVDIEQAYANGLAALQGGDPQVAQAIWTDLALKGSAKAQYSLALLLETGQSPVEPDIKRAVRYYAMAADAGIAEAQTNLGLLYAQGRGVNANPALAVKYWKKSAAAGHAMALFNLGLAYYQGTGIEPDSEEAVALIYRASMQNLKEAQYALGQFYRNGVGIAKSDEEALYWYRIAGRQGHEQAGVAAKELKAEGVKFRGAPDPSLKPREAAVFANTSGQSQTQTQRQTPAEVKLQDMIAPKGTKPKNTSAANNQAQQKPNTVATLPPLNDETAMTVTIEDPVPTLPPVNKQPVEKPITDQQNATAPTRTVEPNRNQASQRVTSNTYTPRQVLMLSESEAEIVYREALVLMQNPDGDRLSNGQFAADKILAAAMAGNARAQRSLGEMYLLGLDIRRNEQQSLYWLREAERNGIEDINGFADALEILGYSEPSRPSVNPQFN